MASQNPTGGQPPLPPDENQQASSAAAESAKPADKKEEKEVKESAERVSKEDQLSDDEEDTPELASTEPVSPSTTATATAAAAASQQAFVSTSSPAANQQVAASTSASTQPAETPAQPRETKAEDEERKRAQEQQSSVAPAVQPVGKKAEADSEPRVEVTAASSSATSTAAGTPKPEPERKAIEEKYRADLKAHFHGIQQMQGKLTKSTLDSLNLLRLENEHLGLEGRLRSHKRINLEPEIDKKVLKDFLEFEANYLEQILSKNPSKYDLRRVKDALGLIEYHSPLVNDQNLSDKIAKLKQNALLPSDRDWPVVDIASTDILKLQDGLKIKHVHYFVDEQERFMRNRHKDILPVTLNFFRDAHAEFLVTPGAEQEKRLFLAKEVLYMKEILEDEKLELGDAERDDIRKTIKDIRDKFPNLGQDQLKVIEFVQELAGKPRLKVATQPSPTPQPVLNLQNPAGQISALQEQFHQQKAGMSGTSSDKSQNAFTPGAETAARERETTRQQIVRAAQSSELQTRKEPLENNKFEALCGNFENMLKTFASTSDLPPPVIVSGQNQKKFSITQNNDNVLSVTLKNDNQGVSYDYKGTIPQSNLDRSIALSLKHAQQHMSPPYEVRGGGMDGIKIMVQRLLSEKLEFEFNPEAEKQIKNSTYKDTNTFLQAMREEITKKPLPKYEDLEQPSPTLELGGKSKKGNVKR